ncbi:MAG: hypothetical protein J0H42_25805 [Rhizobiales bacterium]|nr:hypothetical protein [Hyphomicrobiales bacterium]
MRTEELLRQADNAERHAEQTTDGELKDILKKAAADYRNKARQEALTPIEGGSNVRFV